MSEFEVVLLFLSTFACYYLLKFLNKVWWTPIQLQAKMRSQGIRGPSYKFPHGNIKEISNMKSQFKNKPMDMFSHDIVHRIEPHVYAWSKIYGRNFICWHGSQCQLFVTEQELIKEIMMNKEGAFPKIDWEGPLGRRFGKSLLTNEGEEWAKVRKVANHTFHSESLKSMVPEMCSSVEKMLEKWESYAYGGKEIDVFKEFGMLTTEVISKTAFGSSYMDGKDIFEMLENLTALVIKDVYKLKLPLISFLLRRDNEVEAERLEKRIKGSIMEKVKKRERDFKDGILENLGCDFLGQLVKMSQESDVKRRITREQMIDEIKAIYSAGHLATKILLTWCVLLLATHKEWQEKARKEVKQVFGDKSPDSDGISRLKIMNMIINECLRLYPPGFVLLRKVIKETKIGELTLSPKMNIFIPIFSLHHDPQIWGGDVHLFKPERFAGGVAKASNNNGAAFLPFGMGPRTCVGLNFTTNEAKIAISMILQKYKVILSPNYVHYPDDTFLLTPKYGAQVILEKI